MCAPHGHVVDYEAPQGKRSSRNAVRIDMTEEAKIVSQCANRPARSGSRGVSVHSQGERLAQRKRKAIRLSQLPSTDVYEGPLDLLLDLIRKQDIDIYDIPIAKITAQYLAYVEKIRDLDVNVAAEFIYMAAVLIHIKSKMLLPRDPLRRPRSRKIRAANWSTGCWNTKNSSRPRRCCCRSSRLKTPCCPIRR